MPDDDDSLRNRLAAAMSAHQLDDADRCVCGYVGADFPDWDAHLADISVAVVSAWLREWSVAVYAIIPNRAGELAAGLFDRAASDVDPANAIQPCLRHCRLVGRCLARDAGADDCCDSCTVYARTGYDGG